MEKIFISVAVLLLLINVASTEAAVLSRQLREDSFYNPKIAEYDMNHSNAIPSFEELINKLSSYLGKNVIITDCSEQPVPNRPIIDKENSFQIIGNKAFLFTKGKIYQVSVLNSAELNKEDQIKISNELAKNFESNGKIPANVALADGSVKENIDQRKSVYQDIETYSNFLEENNAVILDIYNNIIKYDSEQEERFFEFDPIAFSEKAVSKKDIEKRKNAREKIKSFFDNIIKNQTVIVTSDERKERNLVALLDEIMPDKQFLIADRNDIGSAYYNFIKQEPVVKDGKMNMLVVPEYSAMGSEAKEYVKNSVDNLNHINKTEWDSFIAGENPETNIILIIAEETGFEQKIREAGEKGLLKNKVIMLSVCWQTQGDLIKDLLRSFGASGVFTYKKEINPENIPLMLERMDTSIQEMLEDNENNKGERLFEFMKKILDDNELKNLKNLHHDVRIDKLKLLYFS